MSIESKEQREARYAQKAAKGCLRAIAAYAVVGTVGHFYNNPNGLLVMVCLDLVDMAVATALSRWTLARDEAGNVTGRSWFGAVLHVVFFVATVAVGLVVAVGSK